MGCLETKRCYSLSGMQHEVTLSCLGFLPRRPPLPCGSYACIICRSKDKNKMPGNKKKNKGGNKAKNAPARSNAANKDDLAGLDEMLR